MHQGSLCVEGIGGFLSGHFHLDVSIQDECVVRNRDYAKVFPRIGDVQIGRVIFDGDALLAPIQTEDVQMAVVKVHDVALVLITIDEVHERCMCLPDLIGEVCQKDGGRSFLQAARFCGKAVNLLFKLLRET